MITIVNKKSQTALSSGIYVGRPSPLGNPYIVCVDGTREQVIQKYRKWLQIQLSNEHSKASKMINDIFNKAKTGDVTLVCWCVPLLCHAEVIKEVVENKLKETL